MPPAGGLSVAGVDAVVLGASHDGLGDNLAPRLGVYGPGAPLEQRGFDFFFAFSATPPRPERRLVAGPAPG